MAQKHATEDPAISVGIAITLCFMIASCTIFRPNGQRLNKYKSSLTPKPDTRTPNPLTSARKSALQEVSEPHRPCQCPFSPAMPLPIGMYAGGSPN